MKKQITSVSLIKILVLFLMMSLSTVVYAQADLPDAPDDTVAAPIDVYIWVLAFIGLAFGFLKLRAFSTQINK